MDNIDVGSADMLEQIEDMVDFLYMDFANFVAKFGVEVGMAKVAKARVYSNYLEIIVNNLEIMHKDITSYWVDEASISLLELHNIVVLLLDSLHYHSSKLPSTLLVMVNL